MDSGHGVFRTRGIYLQYVRRDTGKEGSGWEGCGNRSYNLFLCIYMFRYLSNFNLTIFKIDDSYEN